MVDSGDLFHNLVTLREEIRPQVQARADSYLAIFESMAHAAQGIGDRDLALGLERLRELSSRANFPFLNANIVDATSGTPVFQERVIVERAGVKIGLFGLLTPEYRLREQQEKRDGFRVLDPIVVAKEQAVRLREEGAEVLVVLSHLTLDESAKLAEAVPGITAILGSQSQQMKRYPHAVETTYIADAYIKGKYLSVLTLFVRPDESKFVFVDPSRKSSVETRIREIEMRIGAREKAIAAAKEAEKDSPKARGTAWLARNLETSRAELATLQTELAGLGDVNITDSSFVAYDLPPMAKTVDDKGEVIAKLDKLKAEFPALAKPGK